MGSDAQADRAAVLAALDAIDAALDVLGSACLDGFGPVELLAVLARREVIGRRGPAVDHRVLVAVQSQARPGELGSTTWPKVLADRLRISQAEAGRRVRDAAVLGPRTAITGEPLPPVWPHLAAAQAACMTDEQVAALHAAYQARTPAANPDGLATADGECSRAKFQALLARQLGAPVGFVPPRAMPARPTRLRRARQMRETS